MNLGAALGVAVREYPLPAGPCDYLLFIGRRTCGVVEAKPEGQTLTGVAAVPRLYGGVAVAPAKLGAEFVVRLREHRHRNSVPRPARPASAFSPPLRVPQACHVVRVPQEGHEPAPQAPRPSCALAGRATRLPSRGHRWYRGIPSTRQSALIGADGNWCWQDLYRLQSGVPPARTCRRRSHLVFSRSQKPRRTDEDRVPAIPATRHREVVH
jgi:hypothetical protein